MVLFGVCVALDWKLALLAFGLLPLTIAFLAWVLPLMASLGSR